MRLVLDANRLFAALIKDSIARKLLFHPSLEFIAPDYILVELSNHKKELLKKSKLPEDEFDILFQSIFENIIIVPSEEINPCYKRAMEIMKNIDPDDAVFLALTFSIIVGVLSGVMPARSAAKMNPVDALRFEQ